MSSALTISTSAPIINTMAIFLSCNKGKGLVNEIVSHLVKTYSNTNISTFIKHIKDNKVVKSHDRDEILKKITLELIQQFREHELYSLLQSNPQLFGDKEITKNLLEHMMSFSSSCYVNISLLMLSLNNDDHKLSILEKISTTDKETQEKFVKMLRHQNIEFDFFQFSPKRQRGIIKTLSLYQGELKLTERYTQYLADIASRKITDYKHFEKETRDNIAKLSFTCRKAFLQGLLSSTKALHPNNQEVINFAESFCTDHENSKIELTTNIYLSCVSAYITSLKPKKSKKNNQHRIDKKKTQNIVCLRSKKSKKKSKNTQTQKPALFNYQQIMKRNQFWNIFRHSSLEKSLLNQTKRLYAKMVKDHGYIYGATTRIQRTLLQEHILKLTNELNKYSEEITSYVIYELIRDRAKFTSEQKNLILSKICTNSNTPQNFLYEILRFAQNTTLSKAVHKNISTRNNEYILVS